MALFIYTDMEPYRSILFKTKSTDVDEKGIVKVAVNGIGIKDSDGDISSPGSFSKRSKRISTGASGFSTMTRPSFLAAL